MCCAFWSVCVCVFHFHTCTFCLLQGDDIISNHSSGTLTLPYITDSNLTYYRCQVNDSVHQVESERLYLNETRQPYIMDAAAGIQGEKFANGTTLRLECKVRGGPVGSAELVIWYNPMGPVSPMGGVTIEINGNVSILIKDNVNLSDAGRYVCAFGIPESQRIFNVTITVPPEIEKFYDTHVTVAPGGRVQFDCVTSGIPPPTVKWLYNVRPHFSVQIGMCTPPSSPLSFLSPPLPSPLSFPFSSLSSPLPPPLFPLPLPSPRQ